MPFALRLGLAGLLAALALAGCTVAGASPAGNTTSSPGPTWATPGVATPTGAPTGLQPPAAPTGLHEWVDESGDPVPAYFEWTPPPGTIGGYYFWTKGVYTDDMTPPPAICGPQWEKLAASAKMYTIDSVSSEPDAYICAFNDAGTSPTVHFTQDTPWVPAQPERPAAPTGLTAEFVTTGGILGEALGWTAPPQPVSGYDLEIWHGGGDILPPTACDPSWMKLAASPRTYKIPAVEVPPSVFICAFNDAGLSPMVKFPAPEPV